MENLLQEQFRATHAEINLALWDITSECTLTMAREDLIFPEIAGNKFRKLKYNLLEARKLKKDLLLTFGGAYSNHLAATAACGERFGFSTVGIVRGEENSEHVITNPTLTFCKRKGMELKFISRSAYRQKEDPTFLGELKKRYPTAYILPEGGTNALAVRGCREILHAETAKFDSICVSVGTGGTMAGIVQAAKSHQHTIGFSALKGTFQKSVIATFTGNKKYEIVDAYSFGGYAKIDAELIRFINDFKQKTGIPLDPIYTGKMMYGIFDMLKNGEFPKNTRIFAIHTGGLQGIEGMNQRLRKKQLPEIQ
ncbi:pyridoxal-phosphate dependent enzyme [Flavobacteriaceae bacterium TK19130]|nr:pyridoxal-phosphate dependent enzyme [Thermobacterium salinum]